MGQFLELFGLSKTLAKMSVSSKSPNVGRKVASETNGTNGSGPGVDMSPEERQRWDVVAKAHEFVAKINKLTPEKLQKFQVQKTLVDAYLSINASMMKVIAKAGTVISEAQDRNKESPFIDSALEQVKIATTELNNAMKRISELLETMNKSDVPGEDESSENKSFQKKPSSRFSFKKK